MTTLKARIEGDELIIEGRAQVGDEYPDICCQGHQWKIAYIFPDEANHGYDSLWGVCQNTDCPVEADSYYKGVSHYLAEDLAEKLAQEDAR